MMTGFRNRKRVNPFVQIDKNMISDEKISWKAKGILAYLLSKPDGWVTYLTDIEKRSTDGRDSVSSGVKELLSAGYLERKRVREKGRFKGWEYSVYEYPNVSESTENGLPEIGKPEDGKAENGKAENGLSENGKPATSNNNLSNNDLSNNDLSNINNDNASANESPFSFYEKNGFGILTPHVGEKIGSWIDDMNEELVIHALKIAIENSVLRWNYAESILKDWSNKKFTSVAQVQAHEVKRKKKSSAGRPWQLQKPEIVPEWFNDKKASTEAVEAITPTTDDEFEERRRKLREELKKTSVRKGVKQT